MHAITIRLIRLCYGDNQEKFAKRLNRHPITLARWESNSLAPDAESENRLAVLASVREVRLPMLDAVLTILLLAEGNDRSTTEHALRASRLAEVTARRLGLKPSEVAEVATAGMLHDVGKVLVPSKILHYPGRLSESDRLIIQKHAAFPEALIACVAGRAVAAAAAQHHERMDGSGYPRGLRGRQICIGGRILATVDEFDARISPRGYRRRHHESAAVLAEMERGGKHDPRVVQVLARVDADEDRRNKKPQRWAEMALKNARPS